MRKTIIRRAVIGFLIGMLVGNLIAFLTCDRTADPVVIVTDKLIQRTGSVSAALIVQTLLSGLLGAVSMGGTVLYDIEEWGLTRTALTHFSLILCTFYAVALGCAWIGPVWQDLLIMGAFEAVGYFIVWLIMFMIYRKQTKELNELIRKK